MAAMRAWHAELASAPGLERGSLMSYATNADIEERLGTATYIELTDDTGLGQAD